MFIRWKMKVKVLVAQLSPTLLTPWTAAHQAPLSMGFSRQEHWSGLPFPSLGDLPYSGIEPGSPTLQATLPTELPRKLTWKTDLGNPLLIALFTCFYFLSLCQISLTLTSRWHLQARVFPSANSGPQEKGQGEPVESQCQQKLTFQNHVCRAPGMSAGTS